MAEPLPADALRAAESIGKADIVIGIPSYNNGRTIGHVVQAANAGLSKYFPAALRRSDQFRRRFDRQHAGSSALGDS